MTDLQKEFEATGYTSWINLDLYPDGKIYTQEYTQWLEKQVLLLRNINTNRFVLIGFEFNNFWKCPDLYAGENEHEILITTDELEKAIVFETIDLADYKRVYLQANYSDYTWYILKINTN